MFLLNEITLLHFRYMRPITRYDINNYNMAFICSLLIASGRKMNHACEILIAVPWPLLIFQKRFLDVVSSNRRWNIVSISCTKSHKIAPNKSSFNINYEKITSMFHPLLRNLAQSIFSGENRKADILSTSRKSRPLLVQKKPDLQP